jgi:hypothetical protein
MSRAPGTVYGTLSVAELFGRFSSNAAIYGAGLVITRAGWIFLLPIYWTRLTPEDYGIIGIAAAIQVFLAPVLSLVAKQSGQQKVPDPLPGQTFEDLPLDLPTILPPGEVAHLVLDMTVGALDVGFTADLQWHAIGAPVCEATTYCTSLPNTFSSGAAIAATGSSSILLNDLTLTASGVPPFHAGRFIMGSVQGFTPFGDGYLCVGGNKRRFPVVFADTNGLTSTALDFTDPSSPTLLIAPGSTWNFQLAFRDPLGGPLTFNTSDAVSVTFCP